MGRVRFRARFWVLLFILLMILGALLYFLVLNGPEGELALGSMRLSHETDTVLVRDETCLTTEKYDKIIFDVAEGAIVEEGAAIAQVFRWGYQDSTMQSLLDVRAEILDYQLEKVEGIINTDLDGVNARIEQTLTAIRNAKTSSEDLLALEQTLKSLLNERMEMLRLIQADEELTALYSQETTQLENLATWKRDIVSAGAGTVSFYFDGYEQALSANKLDMINADLIAAVLKGGASATATTTDAENRPLYRLIDGNHFYLAFLTSVSDPLRVAEGETYTVVFEGYADQPFAGTALAPVIGEKQVVNLLEFHENMGDLMGVRTVKAEILLDASGFTVPLDALSISSAGEPGITLLTGDTETWVAVEVLATDEDNAIIRQRADSSATLAAGLRFKRS